MTDQLLKFLRSEHIEHLIQEGTVRISRLSYFRVLEGNRWIADPDEATTIVDAGGAILAAQAGEIITDNWTPPGFTQTAKASDGGAIIFGSQVQLRYQMPDSFILCISLGEREQLVNAMCRDAKDPYDAAVQVLIPLDLLAHRIYYRGTIVELDHLPVQRAFSRFSFGCVEYDARPHHHTAGPAPEPSPFRKHADFASQSEARIVFEPMLNLQEQYLTIRLPKPERIFTEAFRNFRI